jgi:hypothetical protein
VRGTNGIDQLVQSGPEFGRAATREQPDDEGVGVCG